jgi:preprotein translocase subunit SecA
MITERVREAYESSVRNLPPELVESKERLMVLIAIDRHWQDHLEEMEELRDGVYLRAQGQKDPLVEYKNEGYELFVNLMDEVKQQALRNLFRSAAGLEAYLAQAQSPASAAGPLKINLPTQAADVPGRNSPCICGSGKKFKQCCGRAG